MALKFITAEEAASFVHHNDNVGFSGFTPAGCPKVVPGAIAKKAIAEHEKDICIIGQAINDSYMHLAGLDKKTAATWTSITLIFIGSFLTGIGVYDLIGRRAGAGSIIPITGFANSIVSPAMEFKREGYVMGVGANLFKIAGPVLVYGIGSSILFGFIYYIIQIIFK